MEKERTIRAHGRLSDVIPVFRKRLLTMVAFALAVLFLGACGAIQGEREELGMQL